MVWEKGVQERRLKTALSFGHADSGTETSRTFSFFSIGKKIIRVVGRADACHFDMPGDEPRREELVPVGFPQVDSATG
jgi:hypothetical protein